MADEARPPTGAWRTYLELAAGLGETSRKQVRKVLKDLVGKGNATAEQLKALSGELLAANAANREALGRLVKVEVDRALGRVGLATMEEVNELNSRLRHLERQLLEVRTAQATPAPARTVAPTPAATRAARKAAPRKAAATKAAGAAAKATKVTKVTPAKVTATKATKATPSKAAASKATATPAKATVRRRAVQ